MGLGGGITEVWGSSFGGGDMVMVAETAMGLNGRIVEGSMGGLPWW